MSFWTSHTAVKAIAVLSIISSMASILGFIALFQSGQSGWDRWMVYLTAAGFTVALLLALYTMLVPSSAVVRNVEAKLIELPEGARFVADTHPSGSGVKILQQGEASGMNGDRVVVTFPSPFADPPEFTLASPNSDDLHVAEVTAYFAQVVVREYGQFARKHFTWFAKGHPLYNVKVVEVEPAGGTPEERG